MSPRAFITGASRGIGKATAVALAEAGYDVAISARTVTPGETRDNGMSVHKPDSRPLPGSLSETADLIRAAGREALVVPLDLTVREQTHAAAETILAEWGGVDVLVHNGRYIGPGLMDVLLETPIDAYSLFFEAHAIAPIILTQALLPGMLERGHGTLITVSSAAAFAVPSAPAGQGGWGHAYAVGKAAGHPLAATVFAEFRDRGIRSFNIDPGFVATERNEILTREIGRDIAGGAPPAAIGAVLAWLATSHEADQLTGQSLEAQPLAREHDLYPAW